MGANKLSVLYVEYGMRHRCQGLDFRGIYKLESRELSRLCKHSSQLDILSEKRISQFQQLKGIKRKFLKISAHDFERTLEYESDSSDSSASRDRRRRFRRGGRGGRGGRGDT